MPKAHCNQPTYDVKAHLSRKELRAILDAHGVLAGLFEIQFQEARVTHVVVNHQDPVFRSGRGGLVFGGRGSWNGGCALEWRVPGRFGRCGYGLMTARRPD